MKGKLCENLAVLGTIDPDAYAAGALNSDWVDMSQFNQLLFILAVGTFGTDATVDCKLQEATTAAGAGAADISGKAITQLEDGDDNNSPVEFTG